jgi:lipopolysaccharide transport system ATP-binding protein
MMTQQMPNLPIISVSGAGKIFRAYDHPLHALLARLTGGRWGRHKEFRALHEVSFEVDRGESVGIVGRNGSGKSTLLQLICGIRQPTSGSVEVRGRVSALLELGSGFHPEFTGRENVFMQGAIIGLDRATMEARFDQIAGFADIGDYLEQPVKTYSSGMFVRLAFSVAINVDPDILVVDEALAVGDALFQKRCHRRLATMRESGLTLLLVSHDHEMIRNLTSRALLLERGEAIAWGGTREVSRSYRKLLFEHEAHELACTSAGALPADATRYASDVEDPSYGVGGATICNVQVLDAEQRPRAVFSVGEPIRIRITLRMDTELMQLNAAVILRTVEGIKVYSWGTLNQDMAIWAGATDGKSFWEKRFAAGDETTVTLKLQGNLGAGTYEVQAAISRELERHYGSQQVLHWRDECGFFRVEAGPAAHFFGGICDLHGRAEFDD